MPDGRVEGVPSAMIEAMARGLPVVAGETGGIPSVVLHERTGLIIRAGEKSGLVDSIRRLREDANLRRRLGRAAKKTASQLTWPELGPRIEELLVD